MGPVPDLSNLVALWESDNELLMLKNSLQPKAKYDTVEILNTQTQSWQTQQLAPAGKKYPDERMHAAVCFFQHSLIMHGGLPAGKTKPISDFHILQEN